MSIIGRMLSIKICSFTEIKLNLHALVCENDRILHYDITKYQIDVQGNPLIFHIRQQNYSAWLFYPRVNLFLDLADLSST